MATSDKQNGRVHNGDFSPMPPPTMKKLEVKDKFSLIFEVIWLHILIVPYILLDIFKKIFPPQGKSLQGQVVVVTGAGRGLGRGLALGLAKEGCKVAVADVNKTEVEETAADIVKAGGVAKAYFTNVANIEEVNELQAAVTRDLGPVDILVNNAGLIYGEPLASTQPEVVKAVLAVNLASHFWMAQAFLPSMKNRNSGHIVAIASIAGLAGRVTNGTAYVASKFGLRGFMESLRHELRSNPNNNIKTTTVFPYFINTSGLYVDHWDLRLPPMSIEEAVTATIAGVKREEVNITIPGYLYTFIHFNRLLPEYINDKAAKIFYTRVIPPTAEVRDATPNMAIVEDMVAQKVI